MGCTSHGSAPRRRNWRVCLLLLLCLGCERSGSPPSGQAEALREVRAATGGWMGRLVRGEEPLLAPSRVREGWKAYRDMDLLGALTSFEVGETKTDRVGAARAFLELGDFFRSLDAFFLEAEATSLSGQGGKLGPEDLGRFGLVLLRRGAPEKAASIFEAPAPDGLGAVWAVGRAGLLAREGKLREASDLLSAAEPRGEEDRVLAMVAAHFWGIPWEEGAGGAYSEAVASFRRGDLAGGVMALQMLELTSDGVGADPELFLYPLLSRGLGGLALAALEGLQGPGVHFHRGRALDSAGDPAGAAESYAAVDPGKGGADDAAWMFSAYLGAAEAAQLAVVLRGGALFRLGRRSDAIALWREVLRGEPGPLVLADLAARQQSSGLSGPLGDSAKTAEAAMVEVRETLGRLPEPFAKLYSARVTAVARLVGEIERRRGHFDRALQRLIEAGGESVPERPDFAHPPSYLAEVARAYLDAGEPGPASRVLQALCSEYPSGRLAYESAKRLAGSGRDGAGSSR